MSAILVTGGAGFLGRHVVTKLLERGFSPEEITVVGAHDFANALHGKDIVFHFPDTIEENLDPDQHPGELVYHSIIRDAEIVDAAYRARVSKFVTLGTLYSYPECAMARLKEEDLWNGYPAEPYAAYGLAKRAVLTQLQAYRQQYGWNATYLLPAELYGPYENALGRRNMVGSLVSTICEAKKNNRDRVRIHGMRNFTRDFLFVEDAAEAIVLAAERYDKADPVNLGTGMEISIAQLVERIASLVGFRGEVEWDATRQDGRHRLVLDTSRAEREFGFRPRTSLEQGLERTTRWWETTSATDPGL